MWDFLLDLVQANESVNYAFILAVVASYVFLIWFVICIWVFFDARKRFRSVITSILLSVFSLLFGPPALIFYIMIRPEHTLEEEYYMNLALTGERETRPIYFEGEQGFEIAFSVSVQPKSVEGGKHEMMMNVSWMPQKTEKIEVRAEVPHEKKAYSAGVKGALKGFMRKLKAKANTLREARRARIEKAKERERDKAERVEEKMPKESEQDRDIQKDISLNQNNQFQVKRSKKKKKKKKKKK
ncbi:hypothetical protein JW766_02685 [Candidatus Dojkabacteria bacterium]|nr:hypothetical protein [Candidatus Dojkabacteria bacterium]